ncbi:MAG: Nramp family divalent metal transporter [Myxococcales bacterium]|nr:Nramp family divalent metal transporter [Myxococcales bacterium]
MEQNRHPSLADVHRSVAVPGNRGLLVRILSISGPAFLVSVGYMDPGNWATDLAAGSSYGYTLIWVLLMSNLMAVLLQSLAFRLGIVRRLDLAQLSRARYPRWISLSLYALAEIAITATDMAEVLGSAIALQLLFGLPLVIGVLLTAADTFALLFLNHLGIRKIEALTLGLITIIGAGLLVELFLSRPDWVGVAHGFVPSLPDSAALFIAIGMLGATVMPHNLYLHSSLVQTRAIGDSDEQKRQAIRYNTFDSVLALNTAFFVNAAILVAAAATFHRSGYFEVADIQDAHRLLAPILGSTFAPIAFAVALLAAGQSSTITGTLAGQIVMEGYLNLRIPPWVRRLITRLAAIIPAVAAILYFGDAGTGPLLILSQVILSLQLPFAVIPMIHFAADRRAMGKFAIGRVVKALAWVIAIVIVGLNVMLVAGTVREWLAGGVFLPWRVMLILLLTFVALLLVYVTVEPWLPRLLGRRRLAVGADIHETVMGEIRQIEALTESKPFSRVAIALDFSGQLAAILAETLRVLGERRPPLALMHVVESASARFLGKDAADIEMQKDVERLEQYAAELRRLGFAVSTMIGTGKPVPELTRMIAEFGADLVVVGAHGHRFLSDLFFGSTVDQLRHRIKATVLVVGKRS